MMRRSWTHPFALASLLVGCAAEPERATAVQAILGGAASTNADDAVVFLASAVGCSGALVAPNLVLTARHCLLAKDSLGERCEIDGTSVVGTELPLRHIAARNVEVRIGLDPEGPTVARGREIVTVESETICRNDIALVVLDAPIENAKILPLRLTRPTFIDERVTIIGYGTMGPSSSSNFGARHRREGVPVLDVGRNRFDAEGGLTAPGTILLGPGMCGGDSGGPALAEPSGAIVGVASLMSRLVCDEQSLNAYAQVAEYYDLVLEAFTRAEAEPWLENEAAPMLSTKPAESGCSLAPKAPRTPWELGLPLALVAAYLRRRSSTTGAKPK